LQAHERALEEYEGKQNPPMPPELETFLKGYGWIWGNRWLFDLSFEDCWPRMLKIFNEWSQNTGFELHEEIAWYVSQELETEREELGRNLSFVEERSIIEETTKAVISSRKLREEKHDREFKEFKYKKKAPGRNIKTGPDHDALLARKRRLTYYHLNKVEGWSYSEILSGEFLYSWEQKPSGEFWGTLPFGPGPFDTNPDEKEIWRNFKNHWPNSPDWGKRKHHGNVEFLKEEIRQAKKTIRAVEAGWFPDFPIIK